MKAYTTVKAISKSLMYFSVFALVITAGIFVYNKNKVGADDIGMGTGMSGVVFTPTELTTHSTRNPNLKQYKILVQGSHPSADHFSVFVSEPNQPAIDVNNYSNLCAAISRPNIYRIATESCPNGQCDKQITWDPSQGGSRQFIVMFMKSATTVACAASNILGTADWVVDVTYIQPFQRGVDISIDHDSLNAVVNEDYVVRVAATAAEQPISKLALFVQKAGTTYDLSAQNVCHPVAADCVLCLQAEKDCGIDGQPGGTCASDLTWKPSQVGVHRFVAVALGSSLNAPDCAANVRGVAYYGVGVTAAPTEGEGSIDTPGEGNGASTEFANPEINPAGIKDTNGILDKIGWFVFEILSIIALSTIIFGGFVYITAGGNDQQLKKGKNAISYGIIAIVLVFLAAGIITASLWLLGQLKLVGIGSVDSWLTRP